MTLTPFSRMAGRIRNLTFADWALLGEAFLVLAVGSVAIRLAPFRILGRIASRPVSGVSPGPEVRANMVARVRWAVLANARRAPWRAVCFQQGLAAHLMLRRRGIDSTLFYGARVDAARGLEAHVWVRDGESDVIGCEQADRFAVLTTFAGPRRPPAAA